MKSSRRKAKVTCTTIVSSNQTAYVYKGCVSENERLISDIIKVSKKPNIGWYLVTMDIGKPLFS